MSAYNAANQTRTAIAAPNTWTSLTIPAGASDALLSVEDSTATWRVSTDNTLNATTQGTFIAASGALKWDGTSVISTTIYVSASNATTAILLYTLG